MYRRPGDLKYRGTRPKHHNRHSFSYHKSRAFWLQGDYHKHIKRHVRRQERVYARQELAHGREPDRRFRHGRVLYECW